MNVHTKLHIQTLKNTQNTGLHTQSNLIHIHAVYAVFNHIFDKTIQCVSKQSRMHLSKAFTGRGRRGELI